MLGVVLSTTKQYKFDTIYFGAIRPITTSTTY